MERSKRNKSRNSNKSRHNVNVNTEISSENGNISSNQTSSNSDRIGYHSQQTSNASGGLVRSKPCREIYRPPNCRKGRNNQNQPIPGHYQNYSYNSYNNASTNTDHTYNNDDNPYDVHHSSLAKSDGSNSIPIPKPKDISASLNQNQEMISPIGHGFRPLNIHAKEFHFKPPFNNTGFQEDMSPYPYYGIVSTTGLGSGSSSSGQIQSSSTSPFYSLCQSKSSGDIMNIIRPNSYQAQTIQVEERKNTNSFYDIAGSQFQYYNREIERNTNTARLQQSKSSGNIPGKNKVVRFVDDTNTRCQNLGEQGSFDQLLRSTNSLRINGENVSNLTSGFETPLSVPAEPQITLLKKSRTTIHMGMGGGSQTNNSQLNQISNKFNRNYQRQSAPTPIYLPTTGLIPSPSILTGTSSTSTPETILKRSKSFNSKPSVQVNNFGNSRSEKLTDTVVYSASPNFGDFCINKWPKAIQESITSAVIGGERVAPRHRINMVTSIFDTLFETNNIIDTVRNTDDNNDILTTEALNESITIEKSRENGNIIDLTVPAVKICLYFIQRENDRTVMESLLNTCFATYQSLAVAHGLLQCSGNTQISNTKNKWSIFLSFLSLFYSQVKVLRVQQKTLGNSVEQISVTILTILCDSCLATLRSLPICHSPQTMDCLFTVMTSIGRDMEKTFPHKMKQILTSVRDALLGLGPYATLTEAPPVVQKTLMQLIELISSNWHLPASAVRYYYAHPTSSTAPNNFELQTQNR